jgi:hypothetical protein
MDDAMRVNFLGGGAAGAAANTKALRATQLNAAIDSIESGGGPAPMPPTQPQGGVQFFNGARPNQAEMLARQRKLSEMLRMRDGVR